MATRQLELSRRDALGLLTLAGVGFSLWGCGAKGKSSAKRPAIPLPEDVSGCVLDPQRLAPLRECMECSGPESPTDDWNHSCIHPWSGAYSCGRLAVPGGPNEHDHDSEEVARCRRLANEAGQACGSLEVYSESSSKLAPFFITANQKTPAGRLTPDLVRAAFGGTIYPQAKIDISPLEAGSRGWRELVDWGDGARDLSPKEQERIQQWRAVREWFHAQDELRESGFVMIGEDRLSETNFGCVFPRLVLGITAAGSLVGVCSYVVHT